ncbi:MAG: hypothetical protein L7T87_03860 [Schleiferiaceae bacterium]|nr:hypothetical protein [Schleiferiaceae bacterium]
MPIRAYIINHVSRESVETIFELRDTYKMKSKQELMDIYNKGYAKGFYGVQMQSLHFIGLHYAFKDVFGLSPFTAVGNYISFNKPIVLLDDGSWQFVEDFIHEN